MSRLLGCLGVVQYYTDPQYNCDEVDNLSINRSGFCRSDIMNYPFEVDLVAFEYALVNAVQHTGHRMRFAGHAQRPK